MSKVQRLAVLVCLLWGANAWGAPFKDDFNRPNGVVGNGWSTQVDGTIKVEIVDNEVLISGTQAVDWQRCGIYRVVADETRFACDFRNDNAFTDSISTEENSLTKHRA